MQFVLREKFLATVDKRNESAVLVFDYEEGVVIHHILLSDEIIQIFDPTILFDANIVPSSVYNTFFARSVNHTIFEIELSETRHLVHPFTYTNEESDPITCACACYLNLSNTSLRSFLDKSAGTCIITGHHSGAVRMLSSNATYNEE